MKDRAISWSLVSLLIVGSTARRGISSDLLRRHGLAFAAFAVLVLFTGRHIFFSGELPAGTDMFGWLARPEFLARNGEAFSIWTGSQLGATRQFNLETAMAAVVGLIHSPIVTLRLFLFAGMLLAPLSMYAATYVWFRSRFAAFVAGLVFLTTQYFVGQWTSGHLNLAIMYAAGPLMLVTFDRMITIRTANAAITFAVVGAAIVLLSRVDAVLYFGPALFVILIIRLILSGITRTDLTRIVRAGSIAFLTFMILVSPIWLPIIFGAAPGFAGGNPNLDSSLEHHRSHSFSPLETAIGQARELGYLGTLVGYSWNSTHPFLAPRLYDQLRMVVLVTALLAVAFRPNRTTLMLTIILFVGIFLASGPHGPGASLYTQLYDNVPLFESLRIPNRWLMISSIGLSSLVGYGIYLFTRFVNVRANIKIRQHIKHRKPQYVNVPVSVAAVFVIWSLVSLPVWYIYQNGYLVWQPPDGIATDLDSASEVTGRVMTSPYAQRWMRVSALPGFDEQGAWIEHDLGIDSGYFHGRPVIGPTADLISDSYVDYINGSMLENNGVALAELLSIADVSRIIVLPYLPTTTVPSGRPANWEVEYFRTQPELEGNLSPAGSLIFDVQPDLPKMFLSGRTWATVGGLGALSSLASLPDVELGGQGIVLLYQLAELYGADRVRTAIAESDGLILADAGLEELAMLLLDSHQDISLSTPGTGELSTDAVGWSLSDGARNLGMLVLNNFTLSGQGGLTLDVPFKATEANQYDLWVRLRQVRGGSTIVFSVDGERVGSIEPQSFDAHHGTMEWVRVGTVDTQGEQLLTISTVGTSPVDIDVIRLVTRGSYDQALAEASAISRSNTTIQVLEAERLGGQSQESYQSHITVEDQNAGWLHAVRRTGTSPVSLTGPFLTPNSAFWYRARLTPGDEVVTNPSSDPPPQASDPFGLGEDEPLLVVMPAWVSDSPEHIQLSTNEDGVVLAESVLLPRPRFTMLEAIFDEPHDFLGADSLLLRFDVSRNEGSSGAWQFIVTSADGRDDFAIFRIDEDDIVSGNVLIDLNSPVSTSGSVDWSAITRFRIASEKEWNGDLIVGSATVFNAPESSQTSWQWLSGGQLNLGSDSSTVDLWLLGQSVVDQLVVVSDPERTPTLSELFGSTSDTGPTVSAITRTSATDYEVNIRTDGPALLVFSESYHPLWKAKSSLGGSYDSVPAYGFLNGFFIDQPGEQVVSISFSGQQSARVSGWLFFLTVLGLLAYWAYQFAIRRSLKLSRQWFFAALVLLAISLTLQIWHWRSVDYLLG